MFKVTFHEWPILCVVPFSLGTSGCVDGDDLEVTIVIPSYGVCPFESTPPQPRESAADSASNEKWYP